MNNKASWLVLFTDLCADSTGKPPDSLAGCASLPRAFHVKHDGNRVTLDLSTEQDSGTNTLDYNSSLRHWKNCTSSTAWKFYFQNISRVFLEYFHFHTMELDKTMEIGFSNLFLQYFQNMSILGMEEFKFSSEDGSSQETSPSC